MKRDFNMWLSTFRESIANYSYYVDFKTVYKNVNEVKDELILLNSLLGSKTIEKDFKKLYYYHPKIMEAIPLLLAKREKVVFCMDENGAFNYNFKLSMFGDIQTPNLSYAWRDKLCYFMRETGLFELLENHISNDLVDYALGIEAGLNSNARKNRGGHLMEDLVESFIKKAGFVKNQTYFKEMYLSDLERMSGLDLAALSNSGNTVKRFDFVIISSKCVYACECNFYASGGSKLNETARSYKTLALESKGIVGFKFVWFTDGLGWSSAKNNLMETFDILDDIYNIKELEDGVLSSF